MRCRIARLGRFWRFRAGLWWSFSDRQYWALLYCMRKCRHDIVQPCNLLIADLQLVQECRHYIR